MVKHFSMPSRPALGPSKSFPQAAREQWPTLCCDFSSCFFWLNQLSLGSVSSFHLHSQGPKDICWAPITS